MFIRLLLVLTWGEDGNLIFRSVFFCSVGSAVNTGEKKKNLTPLESRFDLCVRKSYALNGAPYLMPLSAK